MKVWPPIIYNINNKISGRQPQKCVEVVQRFRNWLRLHVQGPVKSKLTKRCPTVRAPRPNGGLHIAREGTCSSFFVSPSRQQHPEDGDGVSHWNVGEVLHPDATVWRKISLNSVAPKSVRLITLSNVSSTLHFFFIKWACTFRLIHGISSIIRLDFTIETVCSLWGGNWIAKPSTNK